MINAVVALVGYAGFLYLVFVVRTDRAIWVRFSSRADVAAGAVLVIALSCSLVSPLLVLFHRLHPWASPPAAILAGAVLLAVGVAGALAAQRQLGPAWRPGIDPHDHPPLITDGVYRRSRHPFYVGWVLVAAGVALISPTPLTVAGLAGLIVSLEIVVRLVEEPALRATHSRAYAEYARRTRRFV